MKDIKILMVAIYLLFFYLLDLTLLNAGYIFHSLAIVQHAADISLVLLCLSPLFLPRILNTTFKEIAVSVLFAIGIYAICLCLSLLIFDVTTDGQTYHLQTVADLLAGWNPVHGSPQNNDPNNIYIQHYGKAYEYAAYTIYALTGKAEGGKMFNMALMISSFLLLVYSTRFLNMSIRPFLKYVLILLIACNPITIYQLFTYYVDGQLSSCFIIMMVGVFCFLHNRKQGMLILLPAIVLLCNLKFTGVVYCVLILFLGLVSCIIFRKKIIGSYLVSSTVFFLFAMVLIGYNPYIRNTLENGHPFYPLMGKNHVDIINNNAAPESFSHENRIEKMIIASMARSNNMNGSVTVPEPIAKLPFTFKLHEWIVFKSHDVRMGGMGPLWGGILLLNLVAFISIVITFRKNKKLLYLYILLTVFLTATIVINPECWYMRYVPQAWLLPCISIFFLMLAEGKFVRYLQWAMVWVMLIDLAGTTAVSVSSDVIITQEVRSEMRWMKKLSAPVPVAFNGYVSNKFRMDSYGIDYKEIQPEDSSAYLTGYKKLAIPNSATIVYYPNQVADYVPNRLFDFLSNYVKSRKHG